MTTQPLVLMTSAYLLALIAIVWLTRATRRRVVGALAGGAVSGGVGLVAVVMGEASGWWRVPVVSAPRLLALGYLGFAVSLAPVYLVTWRVARRFGWRGLAACVGAVALIGPVRDYRFAATFPEWFVIAPGVGPALAISVTYIVWVALGHAVMRMVAGPAASDRLRGGATRAG